MMLCYRRLIDDDQAAQLRISVSRLCVIPSGGCRSRGINAERFSYPRAKPYSVIPGYDSRAGTGAVSIAYRRNRTPACRHAGTFRCAGRFSNRPAPFAAPHEGRAGAAPMRRGHTNCEHRRRWHRRDVLNCALLAIELGEHLHLRPSIEQVLDPGAHLLHMVGLAMVIERCLVLVNLVTNEMSRGDV